MAIGITLNTQALYTNQNITLGGTCTKLVVSFTDVNNNTGIAVTYNSIALTQGVLRLASGMTTTIWYLDTPPTGAAYALSITGSGTIFAYIGVYEITGASGGVGATQTTTGSGTSTTLSITTTKDNSLILNAIGVTVSNASSATNGETQRYTGTDGGANYRISGASLVKATAGAQTTGFNHGNGTTVLVALEIKEPTASTVVLAQGSFSLTGFALLMTRTRTIVLAVGNFIYTGYDVTLSKMQNFINKVKNLGSWTNKDKT